MRAYASTALIAAATLIAASVQAQPAVPARVQLAANAVTSYAVQAAYTGPQLNVGYSVSARRIADCLASFPGYNPKTDMIWSRSAPKQRCPL